ncbi:sulfite exporter TauE/SafE family protein [Streptomyces sp. NPDC051018]|uniref:sulfite exporter TauE/SafE family protein n=1 Tax=Streptomyces sp. NPDC051018 TaxID=3365639 RepID=UPI0037997CDA
MNTGLLVLLALAAGIGTAAVGPGGVLVTADLLLLTGLTPEQVSGTAIATQTAVGLLGASVFLRSGQLRDPDTVRVAWALAGVSLAGTPVGVVLNGLVSGRGFALGLAVLTATAGVLVWTRERRAPEAPGTPVPRLPATTVMTTGFLVAAASGAFGLGGPLLAVPLLIALGMPLLPVLAAAQVQSIVIAGVGSLGYLAQGAVDPLLALLTGIPQLAGILIGWKLARMLSGRTLKYTLAAVLTALAPCLAFQR